MKFLVLCAVLFAALASPSVASERFSYLDEVVSWLAGRPVYVQCLTRTETDLDPWMQGADAYVEVITDPATGQRRPSDHTVLADPFCSILNDLRNSDFSRYRGGWYAASVLVLVHEAGHLRGKSFPKWDDEGSVNCWAARRATAVAQLKFNLSPQQAPFFKSLIRYIVASQPKEYRPSACTIP